MNKKIAIVSLGYLWFPCESGPSRFFDIACTFAQAGYDVECITTSFQHFKKAPRDKETILSQNYPFKITFIDTPPYKKNIDVRRVLSNQKAARNLEAYLKTHVSEYDLVYLSIPANNVAAVVSSLCRQAGVPVIVDVEDLWPEAMSMIVKSEFLRKLLFSSFERDAERTYQNASAIVGTSEDYTERAFKKRVRDIPFRTVYVGCNLQDFDQGIHDFVHEVQKPEGEYWVTYAGSISTSYDIKNLIDAGRLLESEGVQLQILGTGSEAEMLQTYSAGFSNIHFWGYVPYPKMAAVLSKSDIVVNSFVKGAPQSIVNKVGDYLASGKPMINTLENPVFCNLIQNEKVGQNVEANNPEALKNAILLLKNNSSLSEELGRNARALAEAEFDRKAAYPRIVELAERVMEGQSF